MKIEKKYIIAGGLAVVSIALAGAYLQYKRMMNYTLSFKGVKIRKVDAKNISFDVFLAFKNMSNLSVKIIEVFTKVYVNDKFVADVDNKKAQLIQSNATSIISATINMDVKGITDVLGGSYISLIAEPNKIVIKADIIMKAKLWFFTVNIPYTYLTTLKEIMTPTPSIVE